MARPQTLSRPRSSVVARPRKTAAQLAAEVAVREAAHDRELADVRGLADDWFTGDESSLALDLTDRSQAAVDAVKARAAELGVVAVQVPGRRVVVRLARA